MTPFRETYGVAAPLMRPDIDTDQMISHHFLITRSRNGLGRGLFHAWRKPDGVEDPDFPLNKPAFRDAPILLAGANFACGSSREHAVWAVLDYGIRVVIAPSFGVHFARNAVKNGLLPVVLPADALQEIATASEESAGARRVRVSLVDRVVALDGGATFTFDIDDDARTALLEGLDGIGLTLVREAEITAFHLENLRLRPWLRATHG